MPPYSAPTDLHNTQLTHEISPPHHAENTQAPPLNNVTINDLFILLQELLNSTRQQQQTYHPPSPRIPIDMSKFHGKPHESLSMWLF